MHLDKTQLRHGEEYYDAAAKKTAYWDAVNQQFVFLQLFTKEHIDSDSGFYYFTPNKSTGNNVKNIFPENK